jgi:pullulanase/glycogen debranching enzyme
MCGPWSSVNIKASSSIATGYISYAALFHNRLRNMLATLLLAQGTPMILGGDEFARTQQGNNNGYCQNNEISWGTGATTSAARP